MALSRLRLYFLVLAACATGYGWLIYCRVHFPSGNPTMEVCMIKKATGIPCPSCGSTRSVLALSRGDFHSGILSNPLGFVVAGILIVAPPWIVADFLFGSSTFLTFYRRAEAFVKRWHIAIPLVLLVIANWIWNIIKVI